MQINATSKSSFIFLVARLNSFRTQLELSTQCIKLLSHEPNHWRTPDNWAENWTTISSSNKNNITQRELPIYICRRASFYAQNLSFYFSVHDESIVISPKKGHWLRLSIVLSLWEHKSLIIYCTHTKEYTYEYWIILFCECNKFLHVIIVQ